VVTTAQQQQQLRRKVDLINNRLQGDTQHTDAVPTASTVVDIKLQHLRAAFESMGPSVSTAERARYERIYADFMQSRGGDFATSMYNQEKKQTLA
jgi:hypothetical protein